MNAIRVSSKFIPNYTREKALTHFHFIAVDEKPSPQEISQGYELSSEVNCCCAFRRDTW